jgi:hypothetical protein
MSSEFFTESRVLFRHGLPRIFPVRFRLRLSDGVNADSWATDADPLATFRAGL